VLDLKYDKIRSRLNKYQLVFNLICILSELFNIFKFFYRLFNGDPILGETVNAFINENTAEYITSYKPVLSEPVLTLFNGIMSRVLGEIAVDKFLLMKD